MLDGNGKGSHLRVYGILNLFIFNLGFREHHGPHTPLMTLVDTSRVNATDFPWVDRCCLTCLVFRVAKDSGKLGD